MARQPPGSNWGSEPLIPEEEDALSPLLMDPTHGGMSSVPP